MGKQKKTLLKDIIKIIYKGEIKMKEIIIDGVKVYTIDRISKLYKSRRIRWNEVLHSKNL